MFGNNPCSNRIFRVPNKQSEGEFIYFHVSDSYQMESNGFFQIVLNKAAHFWNNRDRSVALNADGSVTFEDVKDTAEKTTCPASAERFYITCNGSEEDIAACAVRDQTGIMQAVMRREWLCTGQQTAGTALLL